MKYLISLLLLVLIFNSAAAQITIQFIPEIYGRNINGLFNCRISNSFQQQQAYLIITVSERKAGTVCIIKTGAFTIYPGTNPFPVSAARGASINYGQNKLAQITSLNHNFPEGDYEYCFDLNFVHSDNAPEEQCFSYAVAPFADLSLIDPYDRDSICDKRPLFTWQPLIPGVPGAYYQLVLTNLKKGQNPTEAINYNLPIINQYNIVSPILPFPAINPDLIKGGSYVWQITAYKDQTVLNRSEVWQFTVNCRDSIKTVIDDGFRDIEDLLKGNFYAARELVKFSVENPYKSQDFHYEIFPVTNQDKKVKHLPKIKLKTGSNLIKINLADVGAFEDGKFYILKIWLPDGTVKNLRFVYEDLR